MTPRDLHHQTAAQIMSAMACAMRADQTAITALLDAAPADLDAHTRAFLAEARALALTLSAALTTVLCVHRHTPDPRTPASCGGCGTQDCRTVRAITDALTAYGRRSTAVDRAEAWRRAEAWYTRHLKTPPLISVEETPTAYITRPRPIPPSLSHPVLVIDRRTGATTQWPDLPTQTLIAHHTQRPAP
ncbi:hypothetical protein [Thermomonospora cellulosilytica]|uniref:Uncharacterized protein n=1 Tax=Thermomonospora cellulosilytica TaxID=1411118 RepID=A0A7W3R9N4_9ACTN|nr:hypothetical protein [Thermomonospora cellulosilytica]MBA9004814.1 hypothetical protein [Thermomonospora cellulosilytica]